MQSQFHARLKPWRRTSTTCSGDTTAVVVLQMLCRRWVSMGAVAWPGPEAQRRGYLGGGASLPLRPEVGVGVRSLAGWAAEGFRGGVGPLRPQTRGGPRLRHKVD